MSNSNTIKNLNPDGDASYTHYFDENFINLINSLSNEKFSSIFTYCIENYSPVASQSDFSKVAKILGSEIKSDISFNNFYRQIKYLINKGIYFRLSKKFLIELINLGGLKEEKVNVIRDIQKANLDKLLDLINKAEKDSNNNSIKGINKIMDVEVLTEMPSYNTNYEHFKCEDESSAYNGNEDIKKQNVYLNFKLDKKHLGENNFNIYDNNNDGLAVAASNEIGFFQNVNVKMNKVQLAAFYAEIEKIQESLDKLC